MKKDKLLKKLKAFESRIETLTATADRIKEAQKIQNSIIWDKMTSVNTRLCKLESCHHPSGTDEGTNELQKTLPFDDTEIPKQDKQTISTHTIKGKIAIMGIDDAKRLKEISDKFKS